MNCYELLRVRLFVLFCFYFSFLGKKEKIIVVVVLEG